MFLDIHSNTREVKFDLDPRTFKDSWITNARQFKYLCRNSFIVEAAEKRGFTPVER